MATEPRLELVISTTGKASNQIGEAVLADGGSAADAALAIAIAQPALCAGCWDSYAGILEVLHYEADGGTVSSLNAGFNTLRAQVGSRAPVLGRAVGRVLTPGFFAGVDETHRKFGRLPLARLIDPAILVAEQGILVEADFAAVMHRRRRVLLRQPEGRAVFERPDGGVPRAGETLRQPALAHTLRRVATHGATDIYRGAWARRFVEVARRNGEQIELEDLDGYRATWTSPLQTAINGFEVYAPGLPGVGGLYLIEALNLLRASRLDQAGDFNDPDFLYWLIQISRARYFGPEVAVETRARIESAQTLWEDIRRCGRWNFFDAMRNVIATPHSDAVVVRDRQGNVAALCHSIATIQWGNSGLFVDGVSIPDAAVYQRRAIARLGRGQRVPSAMNPAIVLRDGRPRLAIASIGASVHELSLQGLLRTVLCSQPVSELPEVPDFLCPQWDGVYRLADLEGPIVEVLADLLFGVVALMLRPFPVLARRVLDMDAPILEGSGTGRLSSELERRGQPTVLLESDPMPSTLVCIEVGDGEPVGVVRSTARSARYP